MVNPEKITKVTFVSSTADEYRLASRTPSELAILERQLESEDYQFYLSTSFRDVAQIEKCGCELIISYGTGGIKRFGSNCSKNELLNNLKNAFPNVIIPEHD